MANVSSRADILVTAQQAINAHHRTPSGGCAECKTSRPGPCPVWTLGAEVVRLVHASIRDYPVAAPADRRTTPAPLSIQASDVLPQRTAHG